MTRTESKDVGSIRQGYQSACAVPNDLREVQHRPNARRAGTQQSYHPRVRYEAEIEVLHGDTPAWAWQSGNGDRLIDLALTHGCTEWQWRNRDWGVVLDVAFEDEADWLRFRANPGVQAIFDAIPDPVNGLIVHRGWGGSGGIREPRTPRPIAGAGAAEL